MPCPRCVGECRCGFNGGDSTVLIDPETYDPSEEQFSQSLVAARMPEPRQELPRPLSNAQSPAEPTWRSEVTQRVTRYRTRRGYSAADDSLSFNFEASSSDASAADMAASPDTSHQQYASAVAPQETNVIEFPRLAEAAAPTTLAEPVEELAPRIFEAEEAEAEEVEASESFEVSEDFEQNVGEEALYEEMNTSVAIAPFLPSFTLEPPASAEESLAAAAIDLPMEVAPIGLRGFAVLLDMVVALLAGGLFTLVVKQLITLPPDPKLLFSTGLFVVGFFWFSYQMLYLTFAGTTFGMRAARLSLCTFEGRRVYRLRRQVRALTMLLSAMSLGLGFAWAFLDEDNLCWHDRITRTVLR